MALHSNKLEFPLRKDALREVWLQLEKIFTGCQCILANIYYLPLEKGMTLHFLINE